jgi:hypothetical protein
MPSVCLSCIIYTLADKAVEENQYIDIFVMWLIQLLKVKALSKDDVLQITIDQRTLNYLKSKYVCFLQLIKHLPNFRFFINDPPKTYLEGMMWRFNLTPYTQDIFLYLDIDILVLKPLENLTKSMKPNTFYVMLEGSMTDSNYNAAFSETDRLQFKDEDPGYNSGKFAITSQQVRDHIFKEICDRCKFDTTYYTIDQPYFNCVMYELQKTPYLDTELLKEPYVSFNGQGYNCTSTVLFDCAGEPANGKRHIIKYIDFMGLSVINLF